MDSFIHDLIIHVEELNLDINKNSTTLLKKLAYNVLLLQKKVGTIIKESNANTLFREVYIITKVNELEHEINDMLYKLDISSGRSDTFLNDIASKRLMYTKYIAKKPKIDYNMYAEKVQKYSKHSIEEAYKKYPVNQLYILVTDDFDKIKDILLNIQMKPDIGKIMVSRYPLQESTIENVCKKYGVKTKCSMDKLAKVTGKSVLVLKKTYNSYIYKSDITKLDPVTYGLTDKMIQKYKIIQAVGGKDFSYSYYKGSSPTIVIEDYSTFVKYGEVIIPYIRKEDHYPKYNALVEEDIMKFARDAPLIPKVEWDRQVFMRLASKPNVVLPFVAEVTTQIKKQIKNNPEISISLNTLKVYSKLVIEKELELQKHSVKEDNPVKRGKLIKLTAIINAIDQLPDLIVKKSAVLV